MHVGEFQYTLDTLVLWVSWQLTSSLPLVQYRRGTVKRFLPILISGRSNVYLSTMHRLVRSHNENNSANSGSEHYISAPPANAAERVIFEKINFTSGMQVTKGNTGVRSANEVTERDIVTSAARELVGLETLFTIRYVNQNVAKLCAFLERCHAYRTIP
jgi:hypothetical protein